MIERADQLILNYVSAAADAAHGVLKSDQRLDFAKRLRARIEVERQGSQNPRQVVKLLARFGDPVALVEREARRLAETAPDAASGVSPGIPSGTAPRVAPGAARGTVTPGAVAKAERVAGAGGATPFFPKIVDDAAPPPGAQLGRRLTEGRLTGWRLATDRLAGRRLAEDRLAGRPVRGLPFARLRRTAMSSANPMATGGRDATTIVKEYPRETAAMAILLLAALLVPFGLPAVAIFRVPVLVWAFGALLVAFSEGWVPRDRLLGVGAPLLGYTLGGALVGGLRVGAEPGVQAFVVQFFDVSGVMFMIGTGLGVAWLAYRLLSAR
ncbi:hypothetical protein [Nonomuraea sp. NEAU-A123]|uniref:hypothetical protein n=1 Tax=Nonomuraea sp. NEAU-A123 TaxID=2839649 RepID=UPI001BE449C1|nr:hypothetical protein [Nonomuraea sp. NEAU-A123]MBT2235369.1 hypothetical protein [Nonomuraea sp. NEAU-A123]